MSSTESSLQLNMDSTTGSAVGADSDQLDENPPSEISAATDTSAANAAQTQISPAEHRAINENTNTNIEALTVPTPWDNLDAVDATTKDTAGNDTPSTNEDQESKIQSLALHLADDLQREHTSPLSVFNFDEFELEQRQLQQANLQQLHLHQQQLLHTQYLQRQEHQTKSRKVNLSIQTAESPHLTRSNSFLSQGNSTPNANLAWYYTDETPKYQNRSGSPCTRKDRLYEAMPYRYMEQEFLKEKHLPQHRYQPAIVSKAARRQVEDNKDDFFQRLYDVRKQHTANKITALIHTEVATAQVVNTVHPRVLTAEQRMEVSNRLMNHKTHLNKKFQSQRAEHSNMLKEQQNGRHVRPKSAKMVTQVHRKALSEIFDVLLITAQMKRDEAAKDAQLMNMNGVASLGSPSATVTKHTHSLLNHPPQPGSGEKRSPACAGAPGVSSAHSSPSTGTHRKEAKVSTDELDTSLAQAQYLQPKQLSDAIEVLLAALNPRSISREQFIDFTLHCMNKTYLLQRAQQDNGEGTVDVNNDGPSALEGQKEAQPETNEANLQTLQSPGPVLSVDTQPPPPPAQSSPYGTPQSTGKSIASRGTQRTKPGASLGTPSKPPVASAPVVIPPIGYLLVAASTGGSGTATQREREEGTQAHREYKTHFTGKPHLVAQKTTEKLAKQRYPERTAGAQKIEDSLISYIEVKRNNTLERSLQLEQEKNRECTFKPNINSPYMVRYKSAGRQVPPSRNINAMIRSSSNSNRDASAADLEVHQDLRTSIDSNVESVVSAGSSVVEHRHGLQRVDTRPMLIVQDADGHFSVPIGSIPTPAPVHVPVKSAQSTGYLDQKAHLGFRSRSVSPGSRRRTSSNYLNPGPAPGPRVPSEPPAPVPVPAYKVTCTLPQRNAVPPPPPDFIADLNAQYANMDLNSPSNSSQRSANARGSAKGLPRVPSGRFSYSGGGADIVSKLSSPQAKPKQSGPIVPYQNSPRTAVYQPYKPAQVGVPGDGNSAAPSPKTTAAGTYVDNKQSQDSMQRRMYQDLYYNTP